MQLNRSKLMLACLIASTMAVSACSKTPDSEKDDTLTATAPATGEASNLTERDAKQRLIQTLQANFKKAGVNAKILDAKPTEMPNLYWISMEGMSSVYATADGKFLIQGDVIRLGGEKLSSIGDKLQAAENKKHFADLNVKDLLVYPAQGKVKHVIYVFTDASCPYCHKLHEHIGEITAKGIEIRYIPWPRGEQFIPTMESIWCSADRHSAFNQAIAGTALPPATCKNPVRDLYALGLRMGVNGTPAIYNAEGEYLGGYMTADEIESRVNK
jgi:thiol:disulfide interchange protein DsbC